MDAQDSLEGPRKNFASDFMIRDARGFLFVVADVNLKIGKQRARFSLEHAQHRNRHAPDLQLRALAATQLEHRAPGARRAGDDELHLGTLGAYAARPPSSPH